MITTKDCKKAIIDWILQHPGYVPKLFVEPIDETPATKESNWKRFEKERRGKLNHRGFDCIPYDDQLRAYTIDDGTKILSVRIEGE